MTNQTGALAHVDGRFRPESISHFKIVAKNMAWLLDRPLHQCQEGLARIYGYAGLHELQQVLKRPGIAGPFASRYNILAADDAPAIEDQDRRIHHILFGPPKGYWREDRLASDKYYLVFEMGLFQEAAEHRACVAKIRQALTHGLSLGRWPLVHGWPLGLRAWLAAGYTEPFELGEGWHKMLPVSPYVPMEHADLRWQRRKTGQVRLATMFQTLANWVGGNRPTALEDVDFGQFGDDEGGIVNTSEGLSLGAWLAATSAHGEVAAMHRQAEAIDAFIARPSRATAAACSCVKGLEDPTAFRDRWAFESIKAALERCADTSKALFASSENEGRIQSLFLHMDGDSAAIGEACGCQLWQLHCTVTEVTKPARAARPGASPTLLPLIHANGALLVPHGGDFAAITRSDWYLAHDDSFATKAAAAAFDKIYLPAIGGKYADFGFGKPHCSVVEIDELLIAGGIDVAALKSYFVGMLAFEDNCLADSYGRWCKTLSLADRDDHENTDGDEDGGYAACVYAPAVLLIHVHGCALTFVHAAHQNGKPVRSLQRDARSKPTAHGEAVAAMVMEAVDELAVDVVVYDRAG